MYNQSSKTLSIFATHNAPFILKRAARRYSELYIIFKCINDENGNHVFVTDNHNLTEELLSPIALNEPSNLGLFLQNLVQQYLITELGLLIQNLRNLVAINSIRLCCDANLFFPTSPIISQEFRDLVNLLTPTALIPFTETPACAVDAETYLIQRRVENPLIVGRVSSINQLNQTFSNFFPLVGQESNMSIPTTATASPSLVSPSMDSENEPFAHEITTQSAETETNLPKFS